jgi:hypothetical protein
MTDATDATAPGQKAVESDEPRSVHNRWEIVIVILLGLTAVATAWSGYQASLWDGIQSSSYTQASGARTNAAQQRSAGNQLRIEDLGVFENYIDAAIDGDAEVAEFYRERFRDEFGVAFDAWIALDPLQNPEAPPTPLAMPEYQLAADQKAAELETRADGFFAAGEAANTYSDVYTLTTLLFAVTLFFGAIAERFDYARARIILIAIAGVGLVGGVAVALGQPITSG